MISNLHVNKMQKGIMILMMNDGLHDVNDKKIYD